MLPLYHKSFEMSQSDFLTTPVRAVDFSRLEQPEHAINHEDEISHANPVLQNRSAMQDSGDNLDDSRQVLLAHLRQRYFNKTAMCPGLTPRAPVEFDAEGMFRKTPDLPRSKNFPVEEKLDVDKDTAEYLTSVMNLLTAKDYIDLPISTQLRDLKVDEPLLASDPELDIIHVRNRNKIRLTRDRMMRLGLIDGMNAEHHLSQFRDTGSVKLPDDKLEVDVETAIYLRDILNGIETDNNAWTYPTIETKVSCSTGNMSIC